MLAGVDSGAPIFRKRLYVMLAMLAVVLLTATLLARPAYREVKKWRALQLSDASAQAMRAGDFKTAFEKARAAMELWPNDVRVTRQMAEVCSVVEPANALPYWGQTWLLSHDPADLREVIGAALAARRPDIAVKEYNTLHQLLPKDPLTALVQARVDLAQNDWLDALTALRQVLASGQAPDDAYLLFAAAAQLSPDPQVHDDGLNHLRLLSKRSDELGLRALRALIGYPGQTAQDVKDLADQLQNHPLATRDDKLSALRLRGMLPGADEDSLVKSARDLFPGNDPAALAIVGNWLINQDRNEAVLKLIDSKTALTRNDLFLVRLGAMASLGQWDAISDLLKQPDLPIPDELRELFQARTLTEQKQGELADLAWDNVRLEVANDPAKLRDVADYANRLGLEDYARTLYEQLTDDPDQRRYAFDQLVPLVRKTHETEALYKVLTDMARYYPDDPSVHNDVLYVGFLLGQASPADLASAHDTVVKYPLMLSFRVTLALGYLTVHQPADAAGVFEGIPDSVWKTVPYQHWRAVYVAVLRANGYIKEADDFEANFIDAKDLLPQENSLLDWPAPETAGP